jgi:hypothetical protein
MDQAEVKYILMRTKEERKRPVRLCELVKGMIHAKGYCRLSESCYMEQGVRKSCKHRVLISVLKDKLLYRVR